MRKSGGKYKGIFVEWVPGFWLLPLECIWAYAAIAGNAV